jgi:probable biosynthetic protein (TIGR04098 family)
MAALEAGAATALVGASRCELLLDPRHTGGNRLCESAFLMQLGALQWQQIARLAGTRLTRLRGAGGEPVYASFYYIHERFSPDRPLSSYDIDEMLTIHTAVQLCGALRVDGRHLVRGEDVSCKGPPACIRMSNVFVQKLAGPDHLRVSAPANLDLSRFPRVESPPGSHSLVQRVRSEGRFPKTPGREARRFGPAGFHFRYPINPDRDINGLGLVYFANYITFLDMAERELLRRTGFCAPRIDGRSLVEREIAYYGNARSTDTLSIEVEAALLEDAPGVPPEAELVRFDYRVRRESDGRLVCISAALKSVPQLAQQVVPAWAALEDADDR